LEYPNAEINTQLVAYFMTQLRSLCKDISNYRSELFDCLSFFGIQDSDWDAIMVAISSDQQEGVCK